MRRAIGLTLLLAACGAPATVTAGPSPVAEGERDPLPVKSTTTTTTLAVRPAPTTRASRSNGVHLIPPAERRQVSSTAYCETGTMANGQRTYDGAVAMGTKAHPEPPFGTRFRVLSGPYAGRVLTVSDRIGHGSQFDVAMPGRCSAALDYGRKQITVERVG